MKKLLFLLALFSTPAFAQVPTYGLVEEYDMITVTGGTTLTDLSGNGNNGTLHGTTQNATGTSFNGSSDFISIPSVVGGTSDFTVFICTNPRGYDQNGMIWFDGQTSSNNFHNRMTSQTAETLIQFVGTFTTPPFPPAVSEWHCYYMIRNQSKMTYGILDLDYSQSRNIGANQNITTGSSALGAQNYTGVTNSYFGGTIGFVYIYNRALGQNELINLYNASKTTMAGRGVPMRDYVPAVFPSRIWQRQGVVNQGPSTTGEAFNQTTLYTTTDCQLIANPCFQMYFDNDLGPSQGIYYAESVDGFAPWTMTALSIPGTCCQFDVAKVTGFSFKYIALVNDVAGDISKKQSWTSNDPIHFSLLNANALPVGTGWESSGIANVSIYQLGSTLYTMYEAYGPSTQGCGGATSTDGNTWTKSSSNPLTGDTSSTGGGRCLGPWLWYNAVTSTWYEWENTGTAQTFVYRRQTSVFNQIWQATSPSYYWGGGHGYSLPTFDGTQTPDETSQITTVNLIQPPAGVCKIATTCTYMFYTATDSSSHFRIKLAIAPMGLSALVQTGEGVASTTP